MSLDWALEGLVADGSVTLEVFNQYHLSPCPVSAGSTFAETSEHISLPDDCTIGYIVEALLGVSLTRSPLFHSHLENLDLVSDIQRQVHPWGSDRKTRK